MHPSNDLVRLDLRMSEVPRCQRSATDFSIARILAVDDRVPRPESSGFDNVSCEDAKEERIPILHESYYSYGEVSGEIVVGTSSGASSDSKSATNSKKTSVVEQQSTAVANHAASELPWIQCTRYRPPKLPKRPGTGKHFKRRPGKHPRIPFTTFQLRVLEDKYKKSPYLVRNDVVQLSLILHLPQSRVKIWFQNRRARERRESSQSETTASTVDKDGHT